MEQGNHRDGTSDNVPAPGLYDPILSSIGLPRAVSIPLSGRLDNTARWRGLVALTAVEPPGRSGNWCSTPLTSGKRCVTIYRDMSRHIVQRFKKEEHYG
jgi:hypothetical protein